MIICPKCGQPMPEGTAHCPNCEKENADEQSQFSQPENTIIPAEEVKADQTGVSPKSRLCAMLLGIFLGPYGVSNFYLGKIGRGLAQCLIYCFGFILYAVSIFGAAFHSGNMLTGHSPIWKGLLMMTVSYVWALVDWILVAAGKARDGKNLPVKIWIHDK